MSLVDSDLVVLCDGSTMTIMTFAPPRYALFTYRWRLIVHGGIDGYRLLLYLKATANNQAGTVLHLFTEALLKYGQPARVECDDGVENNDVCTLMESCLRRAVVLSVVQSEN